MKKFMIFILAMLTLAFAVEVFGQETQLTGFVPQYEGNLNGKVYQRRNLTQQEIVLYAEGLVKPKIHPSNPHWNTQWKAYAEKLREQIITGLNAETGRVLDWAEAKEIFLSLPTRKVVGEVKSTGVETIPSQGGKVVGVGVTITRDPYKTSDGGEREVYGKKFRISLVCANTFMGIEYKPEPEVYDPPAPPVKPKDPIVIPCKKEPIIIPCKPGGSTAAAGAKPPIIINGNGATAVPAVNSNGMVPAKW